MAVRLRASNGGGKAFPAKRPPYPEAVPLVLQLLVGALALWVGWSLLGSWWRDWFRG